MHFHLYCVSNSVQLLCFIVLLRIYAVTEKSILVFIASTDDLAIR